MAEDRLITVAIHTYDKAVALKSLLEHEGIVAVLHNVNLSEPVVSSGVRVRIRESDLPQALRIIENAEIFIGKNMQPAAESKLVIVPVDFSDYSMKAADVAFDIASRHKAEILLLHSFINPAADRRVQLTNVLSFELAETVEIEERLREEARKSMDEFESRLRSRIKDGTLPPVKFRGDVMEGVPEDVINEASKIQSPLLIVMATRGADRKEAELIGSVTAELLDICRYPVFTVPESSTISGVDNISSVVFFSNLEQEDMLAIDTMARLLGDAQLNVTIVLIPGKKERTQNVEKVSGAFLDYCRSHYPGFTFTIESLDISKAHEGIKNLVERCDAPLFVLPNKKRNMFYRFFNPSLAHRLLLHADIPMVVIPV